MSLPQGDQAILPSATLTQVRQGVNLVGKQSIHWKTCAEIVGITGKTNRREATGTFHLLPCGFENISINSLFREIIENLSVRNNR